MDYGIHNWTPVEDYSPQAKLSGTGADPTHHVILDDGFKSVGFVITDQQGDRDERTFRRFPHADPTQPYVTEKQASFGGGFGQATFEEDRSKYWRSEGVDTTKDTLVLGPSAHYADGAMTKAEDNLEYTSFAWEQVGHGLRAWVGQPFTPTVQWTETTYLKLWVKRVGNPGALRIKTYTSVTNEPAVQKYTVDVDADDIITDQDGQWVRIAITDTETYSGGVEYWLVLTVADANANGQWFVGCKQAQHSGLKSADGSSWSAASRGFFYRIYGNERTFTARWFDYKQQTYALLSMDTNDASELYMNGWRGACDSNSGNLNSLVDASSQGSNWAAKITGDEQVKIVAGNASVELDDFRQVSSAVNNDITVTPNWLITHNVNDEYVVTNSDYFQNIAVGSAGQLDGRANDVGVSNGMAYICKGGHRGLTFYEGYNRDGVWTDRWATKHEFQADYVSAINDPILGEVLWLGHNTRSSGSYKPWLYLVQPTDYDNLTMKTQFVCSNFGSTAQHEYWQSDVATYVNIYSTPAAEIVVSCGAILSVGTNSTGANYQVNDILDVVFATSAGNGKVKVAAIDGSGAPTSYTIQAEGYDYATGTFDTTGGSGDGNAQVVVNSITQPEGLIAHIDLKDIDGNSRSVDMRYMKYMSVSIKYSTFQGGDIQSALSSTDMKLVLDSVAGASETGFLLVSVPNMISGSVDDERKVFDLDLEQVSGAEKMKSIGLTMTAQPKSYKITIQSNFQAWRDQQPIQVGQVAGDNITGIESFGDPETAWVFTESGFGQIKNNRFNPVPMREIKIARHANNGRGHTVSDVYLMFTWKGRLQRYYRQNIEDLGPDFPKGMQDISGEVVDVQSYPGRVYVAIDGGSTGKSMILCHKGGGWHEVFTSFSGERIRTLHVQPIEGYPDKLWASVGGDLMWFPIELNPADLPATSQYTYRPNGYLDTSWIYTSSRELDKIFRGVLMTMDRANDSDLNAILYYKIDDEDNAWAKIEGDPYSASTQEHLINRTTGDTQGSRIRFRIALETRDQTKTPAVRSTQARIYRIPEVKYQYSWISKLSTISINLRGDEERVAGQYKTVDDALMQLDHWAASLQLLTVRSDIAYINEHEVVLEPIPAQLLMIVHDENIEEQSIQVSVNDA
jgi:hypothetical protein